MPKAFFFFFEGNLFRDAKVSKETSYIAKREAILVNLFRDGVVTEHLRSLIRGRAGSVADRLHERRPLQTGQPKITQFDQTPIVDKEAVLRLEVAVNDGLLV